MNNDLKTLFIKLKTVFPKDFYIIKGKYCIEGKLSFIKNYGSCITILENKWLEVIQSFIKENNLSMECTIIKDVENAKKWVEEENIEFDDVFESTESYHTIVDSLIMKLDKFSSISDWKQFTTDPLFVENIFKNKGIYNLSVGDGNAIRLGKPVLPLVTEKTADKLSYNMSFNSDLDLYQLTMKFNFTHFQVIYFYLAVPMKE